MRESKFRVTAPTVIPVELDEVKDHLRVTNSAADVEVTRKVWVASQALEAYLCRSLMTQTWRLVLDGPPCSDVIELRRQPVASVSSFKYYTTGDVEGDVTTATYALETDLGRMRLKYGQQWPWDLRPTRSLVIEYVCGYGASPTLVPRELRFAVCFVTAWLWYHRVPLVDEAVFKDPMLAQILTPYRVRE